MKKKNVLKIDAARREVTVDGRAVRLTKLEFNLLAALHGNRRAWTYDQLMTKIWGVTKAMDVDSRTTSQHVARVRRKLVPRKAKPLGRTGATDETFITTVDGIGYKITAGV